ncbi:MAG: hypothetical protein AAB225_19870 [Acidobacteriota bacterium]
MPKMIQIRHVPDHVHRKLKARAGKKGMSLSDYLLKEVERLAQEPTVEEFLERLSRREPVNLPIPAADVIRAERDSR